MLFDNVDFALLSGGSGKDHVEEMPAAVFEKLRNDGSGVAVSEMYVFTFKRWKKPKEVWRPCGYFPHGRDYVQEKYEVYLGEELREAFKTDTPETGPPDVSIYYSDVFGRRFVSRFVWRSLTPQDKVEMRDYRLEFEQVEKNDHLDLPEEDEDTIHLTKKRERFDSTTFEFPAQFFQFLSVFHQGAKMLHLPLFQMF